jgi:hypothetical protein
MAKRQAVKRQSGFIQFLLRNPLLLLSTALGIALVVAGVSIKVQTARLGAAQEKTAQAKGELAAFKAAVAAAGERQRIENEMIVSHYKEVNRETTRRYESRIAVLDQRLRSRPPERPDGSAVPTVACPAPGVDAAGGQLVSIEEYRALESRAAQDALTLTELQKWILDTR